MYIYIFIYICIYHICMYICLSIYIYIYMINVNAFFFIVSSWFKLFPVDLIV